MMQRFILGNSFEFFLVWFLLPISLVYPYHSNMRDWCLLTLHAKNGLPGKTFNVEYNVHKGRKKSLANSKKTQHTGNEILSRWRVAGQNNGHVFLFLGWKIIHNCW